MNSLEHLSHLILNTRALKTSDSELILLQEDYSNIQTSLKALEIIKKKNIDTKLLYFCFRRDNGLETYNKFSEDKLTQEEFDLLKKELDK